MTPQQALNAMTKKGRVGTYGVWAFFVLGLCTAGYLVYRAAARLSPTE